jgi:N4-gp56 family major capsid protein
MANTSLSTNSAETAKVWSEQVYRSTIKETFFGNMRGGIDSIVNVVPTLSSKKGDRIRFPLISRLTTDFVTGTDSLRGREDQLTANTCDVELQAYRKGVMDDGGLTRQRAQYDVSAEQATILKNAVKEKIDDLCFGALSTGATKSFYGGTAGSTAALASTDVLTSSLMGKAASWASTGGNRDHEPIRKIKMPGYGMVYVLVVSPAAALALRNSSTWRSEVQNAAPRDMSNPVFTGIVGMSNGVLVVESEFVRSYTNGGVGGNVAYCNGLLLGAQAILHAECDAPRFFSISDDHGWKQGTAVEMILGIKATEFNSKRYGSASVFVAEEV